MPKPSNKSPKASKISETSSELLPTVAGHAGMAVTVIPSPFIGVAQDLEGFGGLFEADNSLAVSRVAVGMIGDGRLLVGLLDLVGTGVSSDTPSTS